MKLSMTLILALALVVPAGAALFQSEPLPYRSFREERIDLRQKAKRVKLRKCRGRIHPLYTPARDVRPHRRDEVLSYWAKRVRGARGAKSMCFPAKMLRRYGRIPEWRQNAWAKIHSCEGSWQDTGDPYWGGLQMDDDFMDSYGSDAQGHYGGYAHRWPWYVQVVVADRAYRSGRGFYPWPTCARRAGLI